MRSDADSHSHALLENKKKFNYIEVEAIMRDAGTRTVWRLRIIGKKKNN
jgi:hypothetical protein